MDKKYNFDKVINRDNTKSEKYNYEKNGAPEGVIPLWVADMDFETLPEVKEALKKAVDHGIYGYSALGDDYIEAVLKWMRRHYNFYPEAEELIPTPGVVYAIAHAIRAFTRKGDSIIIQEPVYYPFRMMIEQNGRNVISNPLIEENGHYRMDLEDLEKKLINSDARVLILCNPHNPVGRVWTRKELEDLVDLCLKYDVLIISDEIHADFIHRDNRHITLPTINQQVADRTILCTAPSKTFNLAGLQVSNIFIPNPELRQQYKHELLRSGSGHLNLMAITAGQAAYEHGEEYVKELNRYLDENFEFIDTYLKENVPEVKANIPEGTYLVWLDCRDLHMDDEELKDFFLNEAGIWLDEGYIFGPQGSGFMRLNAAAPRSILEKALKQLKEAVDRKKEND